MLIVSFTSYLGEAPTIKVYSAFWEVVFLLIVISRLPLKSFVRSSSTMTCVVRRAIRVISAGNSNSFLNAWDPLLSWIYRFKVTDHPELNYAYLSKAQLVSPWPSSLSILVRCGSFLVADH